MIENEAMIVVARNRDDAFTVTLQGPDADGVIGPLAFEPADALDASVWVGGSEAELFSPAATWLDAAAGTVTLTFAAALTAAIAPGTYPLEVFVTPSGGALKIRAAEAWLRLVDSPGSSNTSLPVYGTFQDLKDYGGGSWLDMLRRDGLANCLRERARARAWLDGIVLKALRPLDPRAVYGATFDGGASHPDDAPPSLVTTLASGGLVVDSRIRELAALKALEYVCRARLTFESADVWASRTRHFAAESNRLALGTTVRIVDPDATTSLLYAIPLGVCSIR